MNVVQGKDAILSFLIDTYVPYVCATNITLALDTPSLPTRTRGDGPWRYSVYQDIGYTINLGGVLVFDSANFDGLKMIINQVQFNHLPFRIAYTAADGTINSFQGLAKINSSSTDGSMGDVVKGSYTLEGAGKLEMFEGMIPCDAAITDITIDGATDPSGDVTISYTFDGTIAQVKYRLDGDGDYIYAMVGVDIEYEHLSTGAHFIEIVPICGNGFEGSPLTKDFQITQGGTCTSVITGITVNALKFANNTHTGAATNMKFRVDGGVWYNSPISSSVNLSYLSVGNHNLEEVPICANGVEGTGFIKNFTIASNPSQSKINYDFTFETPGSIAFRIYRNGTLMISATDNVSAFITANVGDSIRFEMQVSGGRNGDMTTFDNTTSTTLDTRGGSSGFVVTYSYTFTPNGHEFTLTGAITDL